MLAKAIQEEETVCHSEALTKEKTQKPGTTNKPSSPASHVALPEPAGCCPEMGSLASHCVLPHVAWAQALFGSLQTHGARNGCFQGNIAVC